MRCIAEYARRGDGLPLPRLYVHGGNENAARLNRAERRPPKLGDSGFESSRDGRYGRVTGWEAGPVLNTARAARHGDRHHHPSATEAEPDGVRHRLEKRLAPKDVSIVRSGFRQSGELTGQAPGTDSKPDGAARLVDQDHNSPPDNADRGCTGGVVSVVQAGQGPTQLHKLRLQRSTRWPASNSGNASQDG